MSSLLLPEGDYQIILADPPWRYSFAQSKSRSVERKYATMKLREIQDLPVRDLASGTDGAVLFCWATFPKLPEAIETIKAWGFKYKTGEPWAKYRNRKGTGYYTRLRHELMLIATIGKAKCPLPANRPDSGMEGGYRGHSYKPLQQYERIEGMYPDRTRRIELFARNGHPGWDAWGLEAPLEGENPAVEVEAIKDQDTERKT